MAGDPRLPRPYRSERPRRRAARHEYRLRELLAQRFLAHVEHAVFAPGEFAGLVDRIARREIDPYSAAAEMLARALAARAAS